MSLIVMELCNGGSLYEIIDSPENAYGMEEEEFKKVISDVGKDLMIRAVESLITRLIISSWK